MEYKTLVASERPTSPTATFTVFVVDEEKYIFCPLRNHAYKVNGKPEEIVRQWWIYRLRDSYGYDFTQLDAEVSVKVGATESKKKADIVVYTDKTRKTARIFVEVKKPNRKDGVDQLQVYMNATGCRLGLWSNGSGPHIYLLRIEPKEGQEQASWRELRNIPRRNEDLAMVDTPITRRELEPTTDFLSLLKECEDHIKAHEGVSVFEEMFKLIFAKLYDERRNLKNDTSAAHFRVGILEAPETARVRIAKLFTDAKDQWAGVFGESEELLLSDESLSFCVSALQKVYLLKSDADVLGSAFEIMINPNMKGDKGQYFTPRHVINMCIQILKPQQNETIFDPACGSGGFLIAAMEHVFNRIRQERDEENEILENQKDYASNNVFGIDYDRTIAKVAKAYMLIWGDGRSNIAIADGLNEANWSDETFAKFSIGKGATRRLRQFDIIATNPPFAGDISADDTLSKYTLAFKEIGGKRKRVNKLARDKLFVERCLRVLKPGGRMAIVLPRGTLKNYTDERLRRFILQRAEVIGAVSLSGVMFKPFTNTKTCVLFLKKRDAEIDDISKLSQKSPLVFGVTTSPGKDRAGNLIRDHQGFIISDLPEIAEYFNTHVKW